MLYSWKPADLLVGQLADISTDLPANELHDELFFTVKMTAQSLELKLIGEGKS